MFRLTVVKPKSSNVVADLNSLGYYNYPLKEGKMFSFLSKVKEDKMLMMNFINKVSPLEGGGFIVETDGAIYKLVPAAIL